jgi:hypothetical protein
VKGLENLLSSNTEQNLLLQSIEIFFNCRDYVMSSEIMEDDKAVGIWKEAANVHLKVLCQHLRSSAKHHERLKSIAGFLTKN